MDNIITIYIKSLTNTKFSDIGDGFSTILKKMNGYYFYLCIKSSSGFQKFIKVDFIFENGGIELYSNLFRFEVVNNIDKITSFLLGEMSIPYNNTGSNYAQNNTGVDDKITIIDKKISDAMKNFESMKSNVVQEKNRIIKERLNIEVIKKDLLSNILTESTKIANDIFLDQIKQEITVKKAALEQNRIEDDKLKAISLTFIDDIKKRAVYDKKILDENIRNINLDIAEEKKNILRSREEANVNNNDTLVVTDLILRDNDDVGISLKGIINNDQKGSAYINTSGNTVVHHSSVFNFAVAPDEDNYIHERSEAVEALNGSLKDIFIGERLGGILDADITAETGAYELFNQHNVSINETSRNPKFKWWVPVDGDHSKKEAVEYADILTIEKNGINIRGDIKVNGKILKNLFSGDKIHFKEEYVDFDGDLEVMETLKAGCITDGFINIENGMISKNENILVIKLEDLSISGSDITSDGHIALKSTVSDITIKSDEGSININAGSGMLIKTRSEMVVGVGSVMVIDAGMMNIHTKGAINIDAGEASNFTTTRGAISINGGGGILLQGNSSEIDISTSGSLDINAALLTIDGTAVSIGGTDTTSLVMKANSDYLKILTLSARNTGASVANLKIDADGTVDIDAVGGINLGKMLGTPINISASTLDIETDAAISIDSSSTMRVNTLGGFALNANSSEIDITTRGNLDINARRLTIDSSDTLDLRMTAATDYVNTMTVSATNRGTSVSNLDIDADGIIEIDGGLGINIGKDLNVPVNIGASKLGIKTYGAISIDGSSTMRINTLGGFALYGNSSEIDISTKGNLDVNAGKLTIDGKTVSIDSKDTTNLTMSANASVAKTMTISANNSNPNNSANINIDADGLVGIYGGRGITIGSSIDSAVKIESGILAINIMEAVTIKSGSTISMNAGGGFALNTKSSEIDISTKGKLDINAGRLTVDGTSISIDSKDATNLTMTANDSTVKIMTISAKNIGSGTANIDIDVDGVVDIDAVSGINIGKNLRAPINIGSSALDIDSVGAITINSQSTISLDAGATFNLKTSSGAITVDGAEGVIIRANSSSIEMSTNESMVLAAGNVVVDGTVVSLDSTDSTNLTMSAGASSTKTLTISANNSDPNNSANIDIDADGIVDIDGVGGINIGTASDTQLQINSSSLTINASESISLDAVGGISIDGNSSKIEILTSDKLTIKSGTLRVSGSVVSLDSSSTVDIDGVGGINIGTVLDTPLKINASVIDINTSGVFAIGAVNGISLNSKSSTIDINGSDGINIGTVVDTSIKINASILDITTSELINIYSKSSISMDAISDISLNSKSSTVDIDGYGGINLGTVLNTPIKIESSVLDINASDGMSINANSSKIDIVTTDVLSIKSGELSVSGTVISLNSTDATNLTMRSDSSSLKTLTISATNKNVASSANIGIGADGTVDIDGAGGINIGNVIDTPIKIDASSLNIRTSEYINLDAVSGISLNAHSSKIEVLTSDELTINSGKLSIKGTVVSLDSSSTVDIDGLDGINIGGAIDTPLKINASVIDINTSGLFAIDAVNGISLNSKSSTVDIDGLDGINIGGAIDTPLKINASVIDINTSGLFAIDAVNGISLNSKSSSVDIDGASGINIGSVVDTPIKIDASILGITSSESINMSSKSNISLDALSGVSIDAHSSKIEITTTDTMMVQSGNLSVDGNSLSLNSTDDTKLTMIADSSLLKTLTISAVNNGVTSSSNIDIDADGVIDIDGGGGINIGTTTNTPIKIDASSLNIKASEYINLDALSGFLLNAHTSKIEILTSDVLVINTGKMSVKGTAVSLDSSSDIDIDASGNVDIDGATGINIGTVADTPIKIEASVLDINTSGLMGIVAVGGISLNSKSSSVAIDGATGINIGTATDTPIKIDASVLDINTSESINISTMSNINLDAVNGISLNAHSSKINILTDNSLVINSGALSVDGTTASLNSTDATNLTMKANDPLTKILTISANNSDPTSSSNIDIDADGMVDIDGARGINIGTALDVAVNIASSTLDVNVAGDITIDSKSNIEMSTVGSMIFTAGPVAVSGTVISIDSTDTTQLKMSANDSSEKTMTISATNSNETGVSNLDIDADGTVDIDGAKGINVGTTLDVPIRIGASTLDIDANDSIAIASISSIDLVAGAPSNLTTTSGTITVDGANGVRIRGNLSEIDISTQGNLDMNAGRVTVDGTYISIDSRNTTNLTMSAHSAYVKNLTISATNTGPSVANIDVDADGVIEIDAVLGISIGKIKDAPVNIGATNLDIDASSTAAITSVGSSSIITTGDNGGIHLLTSHKSGVAFHIDANAHAASEVKIDAGILDINVTSAATIDAGGSIAVATNSTAAITSVGSSSIITTGDNGGIHLLTSHKSGVAFHIDANAHAASEVKIDAGILDINVTSAATIDAGGSIAVATNSTAAITSVGSSSIITTGVTGNIHLVTAHTAGVAFHIDATADAASEVKIDAGILDINVTGAATIDSGGTLDINGGNINIGVAGGDIVIGYEYDSTCTIWDLITQGGAVSGSDRRLKENISDITCATSTLMGIKPRHYSLKSDRKSHKYMGVIAQELQTILPELIRGDAEKEMLAVDYTSMIALLIATVQEQQKVIEQLSLKVGL